MERIGKKTDKYKAEFYERGRETIVRRYAESDYDHLKSVIKGDMEELCADSAAIYEERTIDSDVSLWYYNGTLVASD